MDLDILYAVLILGGIGLFFGIVLGAAANYLAVKKDERLEEILNALPGANCGACGFAGCGSYAESILAGERMNKCPVGGAATAERLAAMMGVEAEAVKPLVARVRCSGKSGQVALKYEYDGVPNCFNANYFAGGPRLCNEGCLGFGSCKEVCPMDAIAVKDGVAVIDSERCTGCGACEGFCPKKVIRLLPKENTTYVACSNRDKGVLTKDLCQTGCIACGLCEKVCEYGAIAVSDHHLAMIDPELCTDCGLCAAKCPKKTIIGVGMNE